jgi:hypothetical protein
VGGAADRGNPADRESLTPVMCPLAMLPLSYGSVRY